MARGRVTDVAGLASQLRQWHVVFGAGVLLFALTVVVLAVVGVTPAGDAERLPLDVLSLVHLGVAALAWSLALLVHGPVILRLPAGVGDPAERELAALARLRAVALARLVCCEAPALFGLALMLMAVISDALAGQPYLACNALSALVFLVYVVVAWPSDEALRGRLDELLRQG